MKKEVFPPGSETEKMINIEQKIAHQVIWWRN